MPRVPYPAGVNAHELWNEHNTERPSHGEEDQERRDSVPDFHLITDETECRDWLLEVMSSNGRQWRDKAKRCSISDHRT